MADERDYRFRLDLVLPKEAETHADQIKTFLAQMLQYAVNKEGWAENESTGYIWLERCGHRLQLPCKTVGRWEVT